MNVAVITHTGYDKYLFEVPAGIKLSEGDPVLVRSCKGESNGKCLYDSFEIDGVALEALVAAMGAKLPLAPVIGQYACVRFINV